MADQGVSNERKKELDKIDPFQEALIKGADYAVAHKKQLLLGLGGIAVVFIVLSIIMYNFQRSEIRASELVAAASGKYAQALAKEPDPKKGLDAVKQDFQTVLAEYANTSAGRMGRVTFAKICYDAQAYDMAFDLYAQALESLDNQAGMENFLLSALGNISQIRKDPQKAKSYYLRIENGDSDLLRDEARFALALLYDAENDRAKSIEMYEKIAKDDKGSIYAAIAQARVKAGQP